MELLTNAFKTSRPISWVNTAYPFFAAYVFIAKEIDLFAIVTGLYFLVPYNLLMYGVNDVFDYESDVNNPRKGSVEGAILAKEIHLRMLRLIAVVNIPWIACVVWLADARTALMFGLVVVLAIIYSAPPLRTKERPLFDSATSSLHFVGPFLVALVALNYVQESILYILAFFSWGLASHAFGAIQDIKPDRQAGIASIATWLGAQKTLWLTIGLYSLSSGLLIFNTAASFATGMVGLLYVLNACEFIGVTDKTSAQVNKGWKRFIYLNWITGAVITMTLIVQY